jgi:broad specificity phosphatase PhoE
MNLLNNYQNLKKIGNLTVPFGGKTKYESFHGGIDLANKSGTSIPAMVPGRVTAVETGHQQGDNGYGNRVQVQDQRGNIHQYAHLSQPLVRPGQVIGQGQEVGKMGASGSSYSPTGGDASHLDYRIKNPQGQYVDPTPVAAKALGSGTAQGQGGPGPDNNEDPMKKTNLILVRHGTTGLNSEGKLRGWANPPLNEKGEKEITKLGAKLNKEHKIDIVETSDLLRAKQTALGLTDKTKHENIKVNDGLRPWNLGNLTGKDIKETLPTLFNYASKKPEEKIPEGESFNTFKNRFLSSIQKIVKENPGKTIAIVTHHRGDRTMAAWEKKGMPKDLSIDIDTFMQKGIEPATARKIVMDRKEKRTSNIAEGVAKAHRKYKHPLKPF